MDEDQEVKENLNPAIQDTLKKYGSIAFEFAKIALIAAAIVIPIRYFLFQPFIVNGESMTPNFASGDYLIVDEISYRFSDPNRGDVVVFRFPENEKQRFIKRVIGLPGETIEIQGGDIFIAQGEERFQIEESYLPEDLVTYGEVNLALGEDEYFVLGDNRTKSYDSRLWGVLPREEIIGKPILRLLPLTNISTVPRPAY